MTRAQLLHRLVPAVVLSFIGAVVLVSATAVAVDKAVKIVDFSFSPRSVSIRVGETVTWTNMGTRDHTVTADNGSFDSGVLSAGDAYANVFLIPGTYRYHCEIHPKRMTGTVVVQPATKTPAPAGSPPPTPPSGTLPPSFSASPAPSLVSAPATPAPTSGPTAPPSVGEDVPLWLPVGAVLAVAIGTLFFIRGRRSTG